MILNNKNDQPMRRAAELIENKLLGRMTEEDQELLIEAKDLELQAKVALHKGSYAIKDTLKKSGWKFYTSAGMGKGWTIEGSFYDIVQSLPENTEDIEIFVASLRKEE